MTFTRVELLYSFVRSETTLTIREKYSHDDWHCGVLLRNVLNFIYALFQTEIHVQNKIPMARAHHCDFIMGAMVSQITILTIVYSTGYSGADQRKHQNSASLAFVRGIHRFPR